MYGSLSTAYQRPYGVVALTESSPVQTFTEPLTIAQVKRACGLPEERVPVDDAEDAMLLGFIRGARVIAETLQYRDLVQKQYDMYLDYWPCREIELQSPLVSVDLVKYRDSDGAYTTLVEDTDYVVDTARGLVTAPYNTYFPCFTAWPTSAILVRFTSGMASTSAFWSDTGATVLQGMMMLILDWHFNRLPIDVRADDIPRHLKTLMSFGALRTVR